MIEHKNLEPALNAQTILMKILPVVLTLAMAAWFIQIVNVYALNLPINDDIQDVLYFLLRASNSSSVSEFISFLFDQHADHKTASSRLIYWALHSTQGVIDFKVLCIIANLEVLLILGLLCSQVEDGKYKFLVFLGAAACLLNPRAYTLMVWAMAGMQWYGVFLYGLISLLLLARKTLITFTAAVITAFLATFSSAIGTMIWPVGLVFLITSGSSQSKTSRIGILVWCTFAILAFSLFIQEFSVVSAQNMDSPQVHIANNLLYNIRFFLALAGSAFSFLSTLAAQLIGALLVAFLIAVTLASGREKASALHYFGWYCLVGIALTSVGRVQVSQSSIFGEPLLLELALTTRYALPSMVLLATVVILVANRCTVAQSRYIPFFAISLLAASSINYAVFQQKLEQFTQNRVDKYNSRGVTVPDSYGRSWKHVLEAAVANGMYLPPDKPLRPAYLPAAGPLKAGASP